MYSKWFNSKGLRAKFLLVFIPLAVVPLIITGLLAAVVLRNSVVSETVKNIEYAQTLLENQIGSILRQSEIYANSIASGILAALEENEATYYPNEQLRKMGLERKIDQVTLPIMAKYHEIASITVIDRKGNIYSTERSFEYQDASILRDELFQRLTASSNQNIWLPMAYQDFFVRDPQVPVLTLGKKLSMVEDMEHFGFLLLSIEETTFANAYTKPEGGHTRFFIVDSDNRVVSSSDKSLVTRPYPAEGAASKEYLVSEIHMENGWRSIIMAPYSELLEGVNQLTLLVVLLILICVVCIVAGTNRLTTNIFIPLNQLVKNMETVGKGNFDLVDTIKSKDEISQLNTRFLHMSGQINKLVTGIEAEQNAKHRMELALLQAQIKPHFLYNTLDLIYILSDMGKNKEARNATKALADFYRSALSKGSDIVELQSEIRNIEAYLYIQQQRYRDVFTYYIEVEEDVLDCPIAKLTLQPIVENAIYHGLKNKSSPGELVLTAKKRGAFVEICIRDNGVGMEANRLGEIYKQLCPTPDKTRGFALANVNRRLRLYFGEDSGLHIESEPHAGTAVTVRLPLQHTKEKDDA